MTDEQNAQNGGDVGKESGLNSKTDIPREAVPKSAPAPPQAVAPQLSAPPTNSNRNWFWKCIGAYRPPKNDKKRTAFAKGFQKLWVAGTMGAFFTALVRNLPVHLKQRAWPCDWNYTIDLFVRYGYLLWLLAYFLVSTVGIDDENYQPTKWDITYDVGQSACSLTAAFFLGFILPDQPYKLGAYAITNGVICAICFVALWFFHAGATKGINRLRIAGGVISALSLVLALSVRAVIGAPQTWVFIMFAVLLLVLILLLYAYVRIRIDVGAPVLYSPRGSGSEDLVA
jgi:hypothetical protein